METTPLLDYRYSVRRAAIKRMIINPIFAAMLIILGVIVAYENSILPKSDMPNWGVKIMFLFGWVFIFSSVTVLFIEARFALSSRGQSGEWHVYLDNNNFRWVVPAHAHGPEVGFDTKIEDIERAEHYRINEVDRDGEVREYWLKLKGQTAFRLQHYSSIRLDQVLQALAVAGVPCFEVSIKKDRHGKETRREVNTVLVS